MAKKIYEDSFWYYRIKFLADRYIRSSFKKLKFIGREKIPTDGAVIYAPNHCDALMDPLAVQTMFNNDKMVFVARADVFKGERARRILNYLKIMPINRRRDGIRNMTKTEETINNSIEVLKHRTKFCILPEGAHRPMHGLMPIGKGVARVAYGTWQQVGPDVPVYIVPVGLEYGDYFRYRNTLLIQVGEPINVTEYIRENPGMSEHDIMQGIREMVGSRLSEKIVHVKDEEHYDAIWEVSKLISGRIPASDLKARFDANRDAVARIERFVAEKPDEAEKLFAEVLDFKRMRTEAGISINSINKRHPFGSCLWNTILSLFSLPFFLVWATASLPVWLACELAVRNVKDKAFHNSFRMLILLVGWTILLIVWAIVLLCTVKWYWALALVVFLIPAPNLVYDYFELVRMTVSDWRLVFHGTLRQKYYELLNKIRKI